MAAIAPKLAPLAVFAILCAQARADQASDALAQLKVIADALSAGNPSEAMSPFDRSCPNYDRLSNDFEGLTNAFRIVNEIDPGDEEDSPDQIKLTVTWTLSLRDLGMNNTEQRRADINVRFVLKGRKWKIVDFTPIAIFDPAPAPSNKKQ